MTQKTLNTKKRVSAMQFLFEMLTRTSFDVLPAILTASNNSKRPFSTLRMLFVTRGFDTNLYFCFYLSLKAGKATHSLFICWCRSIVVQEAKNVQQTATIFFQSFPNPDRHQYLDAQGTKAKQDCGNSSHILLTFWFVVSQSIGCCKEVNGNWDCWSHKKSF